MAITKTEKFPLPVERQATGHGCKKIVLSDAQKAWLRKFYPVMENARILKLTTLSSGTLHRFARELGLRKSPEGLAAIRKRALSKFRAMKKQMGENRRRIFARERFRILSGMKRETKLIMRANPYTRSQVTRRYNGVKLHGYFVFDGCADSDPDRMTIYYTSSTRRSAVFERNAAKDGFTIKDGSSL